MGKNNGLGQNNQKRKSGYMAAKLRHYDSNSIHDAVAEELAELCESPGDQGCAEQTDLMQPGTVAVEEEPNPIFSDPNRKG